MLYVDLLLILVTSVSVGIAAPLMGVMIFILGGAGLLQNVRTRRVLGDCAEPPSNAKKIKSAIVALLLGAILCTFIEDTGAPTANLTVETEAMAPIMVLVGLLSVVLLIGLINERGER